MVATGSQLDDVRELSDVTDLDLQILFYFARGKHIGVLVVDAEELAICGP